MPVVRYAPRTVPPEVSHILKGFLALFIKLTAPAVAAGYDRLGFVDQRLSSQQSLDSNGTVATAPINATEEPNAGNGVCAVGDIGVRLLRRPRIRRRIAANPRREGAMLLTADKLNTTMKGSLLKYKSNFTRRF